jgi:hypothetical protein
VALWVQPHFNRRSRFGDSATYGLEAKLRAKLADWRRLLAQNIESAREVLRLLLAEPLRFTPISDAQRRAYAFNAPIALDRLLSGVIELKTHTRVTSARGVTPFTAPGSSWPSFVLGSVQRVA